MRYFDISQINIIKIISIAKLDKSNYPIWNAQNSNNSCKYKFLLSDDLSLLMDKLSFNSNKYLLDSLTRKLKSSCTTLWSQTSMWSLTEVDKVPLTGLPVLGETSDVLKLLLWSVYRSYQCRKLCSFRMGIYKLNLP